MTAATCGVLPVTELELEDSKLKLTDLVRLLLLLVPLRLLGDIILGCFKLKVKPESESLGCFDKVKPSESGESLEVL